MTLRRASSWAIERGGLIAHIGLGDASKREPWPKPSKPRKPLSFCRTQPRFGCPGPCAACNDLGGLWRDYPFASAALHMVAFYYSRRAGRQVPGKRGSRDSRAKDLLASRHYLIWFPVQFCLIIGLLIWVARTDHLSAFEEVLLFLGVGVISGTIGINYSHELMHQKPRIERWLADLLLASVLYGHFRSEHLLVHHRYVGTPRDPVTARYNEGFHRFFPRVLLQCLRSAFRAEQAMLARKGLPWWHNSNPFWRYWAAASRVPVGSICDRRILGSVPFRFPSIHCDLAARTGELCRALRVDPETSGRRKV